MKKQIITLIILALLPLVASADAVEIGGIYYNLVSKAQVAEVTNKPSMEEAWREMLSDQSLYHLVDPKDLMQPIAKSYPELYKYLKERYWQ
jgi:hypothetical protein